MLLSVRGSKGRTSLRLPSQPDGVVIPCGWPPKFIPVRLRRKLFVVNGRMAVGVAGSPNHIRKFLADLIGEFCSASEFTYSELNDYLRQYSSQSFGQAVLEQLGAIILVEAKDRRGTLSIGLASRHNIISERFGRVIAIGTGSDSIVDQVRRYDSNYKFGISQPPAGITEFPEFTTLANNLMLLANLYWKEFATADNIYNAWGGAYDLVYQDTDKRFQFLKQYTIFLRLYDMDQADKGIQLANVLKYERRSEVSYVAMVNNGQLDIFGAKDVTDSDGPLQFRVGGPDFTMNSNVHISILAVGKGGKYLSPIIQIDGLDPLGKAKQTVFTQFDEEGRLCVAFEAKHDDWLTNEANSLFQRHADKCL